jgi:hypothetical protein
MDMGLANCWGCPVTLGSVLGQLVLTLVVVGLGLWLLGTRFAALRALGAIVAIIGFAFALMFTFTVPNWGIINPFSGSLSLFNRTASRSFYFTFDLAIIVALVWSSRREANNPLGKRGARVPN